jgi:hypothetical protein
MTKVDWLGAALDLEAQATRVDSQTVERAMKAGAHRLRLLGAELDRLHGDLERMAQSTSPHRRMAARDLMTDKTTHGVLGTFNDQPEDTK